jgi:uncharacterized membrane protein YedE/YeeE
MSASFDSQLIFALAIVAVAIAGLGYAIWSKVAAIGLLRDDFDRRAPWLALGVVLGGAALYYLKH